MIENIHALNENLIVRVEDFSLFYGDKPALKRINLSIKKNRVTAIIGPSGCGKSTLLRAFNRMNDLIPNVRIEGRILIDGEDICKKDTDLVALRRKVGMVFQKPNPFPMSIYENVAFGLKIAGEKDRARLDQLVEKSLRQAALWDEAGDILDRSALTLSGGQQQRLCLARALVIEPEIILMDEPASALDPISTAKLEALIYSLKKDYTIVIVTHNMQQAARVADYTAFLLLGELVEYDETRKIFTNPTDKRTEDYITGRFG
ncbi:MAG: phosphate ABC transporter ATP-binding protein PstB [Proteobacteria bacterium]|jgi:phosphate transport system ATP-binding protein|nr:phosphate ABC transporter ATP-binding protein PstB [Pseudomonadota bacterium]